MAFHDDGDVSVFFRFCSLLPLMLIKYYLTQCILTFLVLPKILDVFFTHAVSYIDLFSSYVQ